MTYYLKKCWKLNLLAAIFIMAVSACQVLSNMAIMQITENIFEMDMGGFAIWMVINGLLFLLLLSFDQLATVFKGKAVQKMNNSIRLDMAASLAQADYQSFHAQESGEYLSRLTNDINQIETWPGGRSSRALPWWLPWYSAPWPC